MGLGSGLKRGAGGSETSERWGPARRAVARAEFEENGSVIVTCERCTTQFQLDDSRVPEGGVRVRCSRCKHAFKVSRASGAAPSSGTAATVVRDNPSARPPAEDEESDWQFNEDPPRPEEPTSNGPIGAAAAARVVDDLLGGAAGPSASDAAPASDAAAAPAAEADSNLDLGGRDDDLDLDLGSDAPPSASIDIGESGSGLDLVGDDASPPDASSPELEDEGGLFEAPPAEEPGTDATPPPDDELGSPAEWDLFGEDDRREGGDAFGSEAPAIPEGLAFELAQEDLDGGRPAWLGLAARAGSGVGWIAVLALFGFGLFQGVTVPLAAPSEAAVVASVAGVEVESEGRWVDHLVEGPIYVVSGTVRNTGTRSIPAPALGVTLQDASGQPLGDGPRSLGVALDERQRREAPLETWTRPLHAAGRLAPGDRRRFEVVLDRMPRDVQRFQVVALDTPPATPLAAPSLASTPAPDAVADPSAEIPPEPTPDGNGSALAAAPGSPGADAPEGAGASEATRPGAPEIAASEATPDAASERAVADASKASAPGGDSVVAGEAATDAREPSAEVVVPNPAPPSLRRPAATPAAPAPTAP